MGNFDIKIEKFLKAFIDNGGYHNVLTGLKNTMEIAIIGLLIGIAIGTLIASIRVLPKYRTLPRVLDKICSFYVAITVFGLNSGAYVSEIMRGGILSVDPGQLEGGRSVGMSYATTMFKIVIPQAIKNILPTLGNEFITLVKETSIVSFVGAMDLYKVFNDIGTNNYEFMVPYLVMAVIYIIIVCLITLGIKFMERRLRKSDRRS